jgi:2,5-diamino-6-(ribosylamino)-4(3H)-pyrimidinone 5'-phosphate reductase
MTGRPHVILSAGMTLDGRIATVAGDSRISSDEDLKQVHHIRSRVDAVMVGIGTVLADDPLLTARRVGGRDPIRVVVDSRARTPAGSRMLKERANDVIVGVSAAAPTSRVRALEKAGAKVLRCGAKRVDLGALAARLYGMGIKTVLLEGGGRLNWSMLRAGLVDEIRVTIGPILVGGERAVTLVEGPGIKKIDDAVKLSLVGTSMDRDEVTLRYKVRM